MSHSCGISEGNFLVIALFMTAHQIGMVFDSASGIRFPALVESTRIILTDAETAIRRLSFEHTHPGFSERIGNR